MTLASSRAADPFEQDWGLLYGYGLFETMRVYAGTLVLLDRHLDRLFASASAIAMTLPPREHIASRARELARRLHDRVVRVTLTGGDPDRGSPSRLLIADRAVPYTPDDWAKGVAVAIADAPRNERSAIVRHKTLNQLENLLAWRDAVRRGCRESLCFNTAGHLAEGSRSNVFVVSRGTVRTPSEACGLLPGVTRRVVIDLLRDAGVAVEEGTIARDALLACDECFLTNAVMEVMPVNRIDERTLRVAGDDGIARLASRLYRDLVRRETGAS